MLIQSSICNVRLFVNFPHKQWHKEVPPPPVHDIGGGGATGGQLFFCFYIEEVGTVFNRISKYNKKPMYGTFLV